MKIALIWRTIIWKVLKVFAFLIVSPILFLVALFLVLKKRREEEVFLFLEEEEDDDEEEPPFKSAPTA